MLCSFWLGVKLQLLDDRELNYQDILSLSEDFAHASKQQQFIKVWRKEKENQSTKHDKGKKECKREKNK